MCSVELTKEQKEFLEECNLEFSERFTDSDLEYKKVYDLGIPSPPIMYPWFATGKGRYNNRAHNSNTSNSANRDRPGSSRYNDQHRDRNRDYRFEENNYKDREYKHKDRYRPY